MTYTHNYRSSSSYDVDEDVFEDLRWFEREQAEISANRRRTQNLSATIEEYLLKS